MYRTGIQSDNVGPTSLAGLTDVQITAPTNSQVLTYNSVTSKWDNENVPSVPDATPTTAGIVYGSTPVGLGPNCIFGYMDGGGPTMSGFGNTLLGVDSSGLTTGSSNTLVGQQAGYNVSAGNNNVCVGLSAHTYMDGSAAVAVGANTLAASNSVVVGASANSGDDSGIAIGRSAKVQFNNNGSIAIGLNSLVTFNTLSCIAIGNGATINASHNNSIALGQSSSTTSANQLCLGAGIQHIYMPNIVSDATANLGLVGFNSGTGMIKQISQGTNKVKLNLGQISDTSISSPSANQTLTYNGTNWANGLIINTGTYVPNFSSLGNIDYPTSVDARWMRIGSQVQVMVNFNTNLTTLATSFGLDIDLPVASTSPVGSGVMTASSHQASGTGLFSPSPPKITFLGNCSSGGGAINVTCTWMYNVN